MDFHGSVMGLHGIATARLPWHILPHGTSVKTHGIMLFS